MDELRLDAEAVDYLLAAVYFGVVLMIGFAARRRVSDSLDFFLWTRLRPIVVEPKHDPGEGTDDGSGQRPGH